MAEIKRLKFLVPRGYGAMLFATGSVADIPEPWASHFLRNGTAELFASEAPAAEAKSETPAVPARKGKPKKR